MPPAFQRPDGGVSFVVCAPGVDQDAEAARLAALPDYAGWTYVGKLTPPATRRFRACWRHAAGTISVDLPMARDQRLTELRAERDARLAAGDVLTMKAIDSGTAQQRQDVATYKQSLRNLPAAITAQLTALADPVALEAYVPAWPTPPAIP